MQVQLILFGLASEQNSISLTPATALAAVQTHDLQPTQSPKPDLRVKPLPTHAHPCSIN